MSGSGHGLDNVRRRLLALHGEAAQFSLERDPAGGARAVVRIPIEASAR